MSKEVENIVMIGTFLNEKKDNPNRFPTESHLKTGEWENYEKYITSIKFIVKFHVIIFLLCFLNCCLSQTIWKKGNHERGYLIVSV